VDVYGDRLRRQIDELGHRHETASRTAPLSVRLHSCSDVCMLNGRIPRRTARYRPSQGDGAAVLTASGSTDMSSHQRRANWSPSRRTADERDAGMRGVAAAGDVRFASIARRRHRDL
jgi:hypothetical protein